MKILALFFLLLMQGSTFALEENCSMAPLGVTHLDMLGNKEVVAVARAKIGSDPENARIEAELEALNILKGNSEKLHGAYTSRACLLDDYFYVEVRLDRISLEVRERLSKELKQK